MLRYGNKERACPAEKTIRGTIERRNLRWIKVLACLQRPQDFRVGGGESCACRKSAQLGDNAWQHSEGKPLERLAAARGLRLEMAAHRRLAAIGENIIQ